MSENNGYLESLLSELKGVEASMHQLEGLLTQAAEAGAIEKHDEYQRELTNILSNRRDLMRRIEEAEKEPR